MLRIGLEHCPYCLSFKVYRSRPTTLLDRACVLFLLQLVRCHGCMRQYYRPLFRPTPEFPTLSAKKTIQTRIEDEERERSA